MKEWKEKNINKLKQAISAFNFLSLYLLVLILFNILFLNLPLANYLGYEFSILNSILIVLISGIYSVIYFKKINLTSEEKTKILKTLINISLVLLIIPLIISFFSLFRSVTCPISDGIVFYVFLTFPAPIVGIALGILSFSVSRKFSLLIFISFILLIALVPVLEIYFNPQIYFYNPLVGYFPGTIYDEGIAVDFKMISYRFLNVIFFLSVFLLILRALNPYSRFSLKLVWIYSLVVPLSFILMSPQLGYSTSHTSVKKELDKALVSENFEIHYSSSINDSLIKVIALHHEFYHAELEKFFNINFDKKISSLIFTSREQKKRLFGTANTDVAKPWIPEIYISIDNYDRTLKHELAHCFAGQFGSDIFKVADDFNPSMIEGIAMAADPIYSDFDLDYMAALAFSNGFNIEVASLFNSFNFFKQPSSLGYIIAGSFIKYLVDKYGIEKFKELYSDMNFTQKYGKDISVLASEYQIELKNKFQLTDDSADRAKYFYGRKSIFYKICPRYVAKKNNEAWEYYNQKKFTDAKNIFAELLELSDNYSPFVGLAYCYAEENKLDKAIDLLHSNISKFENSAYQYELQFILADLMIKNHDLFTADSLYEKIIMENPNRVLYSLAVLRCDLIAADTIINQYLAGDENTKYVILQSLNTAEYNYNTFPYLASIANSLNINYENFLNNFDQKLEVKDYNACYGLYKLSLYMCEKMDFESARKLAALSARYAKDQSFNNVLESNLNKMNWLQKYSIFELVKFTER